MGVGRWGAVAVLGLALPLGAWAQSTIQAEGGEDSEEPCGTAICGEDEAEVSGGPLDLSHLGSIGPKEASEWGESEDEPWPLREHRLRVVPAGSRAQLDPDGIPRLPRPAWPGAHQVHDWDFAKAFSFPELTRSVDLQAFAYFGGDGHGNPVFAERVRANLYLLEAGVTFFNAVGDTRGDRTEMDLDARIPFTFGRHHQLAILPGVSFPIDSRSWETTNSNVRLQAIYGFGAAGFGVQLRAGFTQGARDQGLLKLREQTSDPATLYGALVSWRFLPAIQLRAEASGEFATDSGPDRLTLLPGLNFFPLGDPRVSLGATAIIETFARRLRFDDASYGVLIHAGVGFI